jgi:hypothetical protein
MHQRSGITALAGGSLTGHQHDHHEYKTADGNQPSEPINPIAAIFSMPSRPTCTRHFALHAIAARPCQPQNVQQLTTPYT